MILLFYLFLLKKNKKNLEKKKGKMGRITDFLNLFQSPVNMRLNHLPKISTFFGFFLSIIIYFILMYAFIQSDIFYRESPQIVMSTKPLEQTPILTLESSLIVVSVTDNKGLAYHDPSLFFIRISNPKMEVASHSFPEFNKQNLHLCIENDTVNRKEFQYLNMKNNYCLVNSHLTVGGDLSQGILSFLNIELLFCKNTTENNNSCKSYEEITNFMKGKFFNFNFEVNNIQVNDHKNPLKKKMIFQNRAISSQIDKRIFITLQPVSVHTNDGIFFSNHSFENGVEIESRESDFIFLEENDVDTPRVSIIFSSIDKVVEVKRNYQSFADIIAVLGGLYSFLFLFGQQVVYLNNKLFLTKTILNNLYIFPQDGSSPQKSSHDLNPVIKVNVIEKISDTERETPQTSQIFKFVDSPPFRIEKLSQKVINEEPPEIENLSKKNSEERPRIKGKYLTPKKMK